MSRVFLASPSNQEPTKAGFPRWERGGIGARRWTHRGQGGFLPPDQTGHHLSAEGGAPLASSGPEAEVLWGERQAGMGSPRSGAAPLPPLFLAENWVRTRRAGDSTYNSRLAALQGQHHGRTLHRRPGSGLGLAPAEPLSPPALHLFTGTELGSRQRVRSSLCLWGSQPTPVGSRAPWTVHLTFPGPRPTLAHPRPI